MIIYSLSITVIAFSSEIFMNLRAISFKISI